MYDTIIIERGHKANTKIMNELHILWYSRIAVLRYILKIFYALAFVQFHSIKSYSFPYKVLAT